MKKYQFQFEPFDIDYVLELAELQGDPHDEKTKSRILDNQIFGKTVYIDGVRSGVFWLSMLHQTVFFDAYKDRRVKHDIMFSTCVFREVVHVIRKNDVCKTFFTIHRKNRLLDRYCESIGFKLVDVGVDCKLYEYRLGEE